MTLTIDHATSVLLMVDVQARLMPAIASADALLPALHRLVAAARLLDVPIAATEQNPDGLGPTVAGLLPLDVTPFHKMTFDACRMPGFGAVLGGRHCVVVAGCEAHVCVLQTVLGLLHAGHRVVVVQDAVGSRTIVNRDAALDRMARHGAERVTVEMVVFEWLQTAEHPRFRDAIRLVK